MPRRDELSEISGVFVTTLDAFGDERGRFVETFRQSWFEGAPAMVQQNRSERQAGTVVGLHYHLHQADYWYVTRGRARVVLHDLRVGSPTEGATAVIDVGEPSSDLGIYIPPGVAHGLAALTDVTMTYLVDHYYDGADELGVAHDDPSLGIDWGVAEPVLSPRDQSSPKRSEIPTDVMPRFGESP